MIAEPTESTTPPSRSRDRAAEQLEIPLRRPADRRAVEHRMVRDDVVADARMDRHRDAVPIRLGEDRRVFPAMLDRDPPGGPACSRIARSRSARAAVSGCRGSAAIAAASSSDVGQRGPVLVDEPAQRPAVAQAVEAPAMRARWMLRRRLVPGAEGAGGDVLARRSRSRRRPGVLPVVDRARAVGGQVREPAARPSSARGSWRRRCAAGGPRRSA